MRLHHNYRRHGLTLVESLVALFIMAIGVVSLMTLFPLGAIRMGQSLRNDRVSQCAWQADGIVRTWWQLEAVEATTPSTASTHFWPGLDYGTNSKTATTNIVAPTAKAPSFVVAIDPVGTKSSSVADTTKIGGNRSKIVRTIPTSLFNSQQKYSTKMCFLNDDIYFEPDGTPTTTTGAVVRGGKYSWLAMIQRPNNSDRFTANLKILVFDGRKDSNERILSQASGDTLRFVDNNKIQVVTTTIPPVKVGGWLMDGTDGKRMDFYRVKSIEEGPSNTYTYELETNLLNTPTEIYCFEGLAEVFDRPQLTPSVFFKPLP